MKGAMLLIGIIAAYQRVISPFLPRRCRFYPTCSHYARQCLTEKPFWSALGQISRRLARCHPWHPGGVDLP